jgi:hypothetical protein
MNDSIEKDDQSWPVHAARLCGISGFSFATQVWLSSFGWRANITLNPESPP